MKTECTQETFDFYPLIKREVVAKFDGGTITSDAGALLLREVDRATAMIQQFAECFTDHRDPDLIEHSVAELVGQRVYGVALGYEDLNDHDDLRHDPLLATLVGKVDPTGQDRQRERDRGKPLAGKSTLNRLELTLPDADRESRYKKSDDAAFSLPTVELLPLPLRQLSLQNPVGGRRGRPFRVGEKVGLEAAPGTLP